MQRLDLLSGRRSLQLDLAGLPFLSCLGPSEGELEIVLDAQQRVIDLKVSLYSARRVLLRELERLAAEADWDVPVAAIRATTTPRFLVDLTLSPAAVRRLSEAEISGEDSLEGLVRKLRPLLKDAHYRLENIREVHAPK